MLQIIILPFQDQRMFKFNKLDYFGRGHYQVDKD